MVIGMGRRNRMTEKKRYYRTNVNLEYNNHEPYYNIRDRKKEGNNVLFMVGGKYTSKEIVDRLNEQEERIQRLKRIMKGVAELLSIEADLFSDKATEHDINAYIELKEFDNKDAYYMAVSIKNAIKMRKGDDR